MRIYLRFLGVGLILGLFTEFTLKIVAGIKPSTFIHAVFAYPWIVSMAYVASRLVDRVVDSRWRGDLLHYVGVGIGGLAIEWTILGNGPESNAFQTGMFAMWTTFCFGPRVLSREANVGSPPVRRFWVTFAITSALMTVCVLAVPGKAKIVAAVLALSAAYVVWSLWLLRIAWRGRHSARPRLRAVRLP